MLLLFMCTAPDTIYYIIIAILCIVPAFNYFTDQVQYVAKKSLRSYPNTLFSFAKVLEAIGLRGFMIIKLFRKAFPNCFAKLPEAGKLFNLAYSSHICAMRSILEATRKLRKLFFATYCNCSLHGLIFP